MGPPAPDGATDRSLLAKSDDIGKKLIFLGSRNSRALKCRTQGKLCYLPQSFNFHAWRWAGGGERDHWYWVSGVPDQTPEEETAGVGPLILSCTVLLHIELGHAQARGGDWVTQLLPVSWTGKSRCCSVRRLTSGHQRVSHMRLATSLQILSPLLMRTEKRDTNQSSRLFVTMSQAKPQPTYLWPPSHSL